MTARTDEDVASDLHHHTKRINDVAREAFNMGIDVTFETLDIHRDSSSGSRRTLVRLETNVSRRL
jgi:hypothetical protein